ncbi:MAG TPA: HD domain-containing protein [Acidimicrobiales bacterium]
MSQIKSLSVEEIEEVLEAGAGRPVEVGDASGRTQAFTHLEHALQVAALLRRYWPGDEELAVAGLVHDIGHLLGASDEEHAEAAGAAVRAALGERVAGVVGLHVAAKRCLVGSEGGYGAALSDDSVTSLARQGGAMTPEACAAFEMLPFAADAVRLRRADESGKVVGLEVGDLGEWMEVVRQVHGRLG